MATMASKREVMAEKNVYPVNLIVLHVGFHYEEMVAVVLLKKYGGKFFPGIESAPLEVWGEGGMLAEYRKAGKTAIDLLAEEGILIIGTAGSIFDEHGTEFPTAVHLIAEYLGIIDRPEFKKILDFCKRVDNDGHSMPFDYHSWLKKAHAFVKFVGNGGDGYFFKDEDDGMQLILNTMLFNIEVELWDQKRFHYDCASEFAKSGRIFKQAYGNSKLKDPEGEIKIAAVEVELNNHVMNRWIRYQHKPDFIVQRTKSTGATAIFTSPQTFNRWQGLVEIRDVLRVIRIMELVKRKILVLDWKVLEVSEHCEACLWWYHNAKGDQILNKCPTAPDTEATVLSLENVVGAIVLAVSLMFNPCDEEQCAGWICERYCLGLLACRRLRFETMHK